MFREGRHILFKSKQLSVQGKNLGVSVYCCGCGFGKVDSLPQLHHVEYSLQLPLHFQSQSSCSLCFLTPIRSSGRSHAVTADSLPDSLCMLVCARNPVCHVDHSSIYLTSYTFSYVKRICYRNATANPTQPPQQPTRALEGGCRVAKFPKP